MLDAGGGGYSGTNWSGTSMIDMWLTVSNQETGKHWTLLSGWRKSYELTLQHMTDVRSYRENLATAWPPEKSPAAAAYLQRLDNLIDHLQQTYDAAVANYDAFSGATLALSSARTDLEKVANEYFANQGKLAAYEQEIAERSGTKGTSSGRPPVPDGRQAELEAQARSIMYGLSSELTTARTQIKQPKPYDDTYDVEAGGKNDNSPAYVPPPIPSITRFSPSSVASANSAGVAGARPHGPTNGTSATSPIPSSMPGLILGEINPPIASPPPTTMPDIPVGGPQLPTILPSALFPPPIAPGMPAIQPIAGISRAIADGFSNGGTRAMPPGGVIGATPGFGLGQPAQGGRPVQSVNPVGGMIGGPNNASQRPGSPSHPGATIGQPMGNVGGRSRGKPGNTDGKVSWDPDNPWRTAQGVVPIVVPFAEQKIDPGPAIGLR